jgi:hypothetical protein
MSFLVLPPEINSMLMYTGAGSSPMLAAAAAWDGLAAELGLSGAVVFVGEARPVSPSPEGTCLVLQSLCGLGLVGRGPL